MLPDSIKVIRKTSKAQRERLIERYLRPADSGPADRARTRPAPLVPRYLIESDLIKSHLKRTEMELTGNLPGLEAHLFTRSKITNFPLNNQIGSLTELSIAALSEPLMVEANLHVAASFFSTMVACADDYLDAEGSYKTYGKELFYVSHAYRDLMDMALQYEVDSGALTPAELKGIRAELGAVLSSLIKSESTTDAASYLYEKSCGDKVVSVLFPASKADKKTKELCVGIGRKTGEAGQLIDDILDYGYDLENSKKNYIIMNGTGLTDAIESAGRRIKEATGMARGLKSYEPVSWVLENLNHVVSTLKRRHKDGLTNTPSTLKLSGAIGRLLESNMPSEQLLIWF